MAERVIFSALDDGSGSKIEMPTSELQRNDNSTSSGTCDFVHKQVPFWPLGYNERRRNT